MIGMHGTRSSLALSHEPDRGGCPSRLVSMPLTARMQPSGTITVCGAQPKSRGRLGMMGSGVSIQVRSTS